MFRRKYKIKRTRKKKGMRKYEEGYAKVRRRVCESKKKGMRK